MPFAILSGRSRKLFPLPSRPILSKRRTAVFLAAAFTISRVGVAQQGSLIPRDSIRVRAPSLLLVNGETVDRFRLDQLVAGVAPGQSLLLRSASSLTAPVPAERGTVRLSPLVPQFLFVHSTSIPFSQNYGAMW